MAVNISQEYAESILATGKVEFHVVRFMYWGMCHAVRIFKRLCKTGNTFYEVQQADDNFLRFISLAGAFDSAEAALQYIAKQEGVEEFVDI